MRPLPPGPRECFLYDKTRGWLPKPRYAEAVDALAHRRLNDLRAKVYRCGVCGAWHIGHLKA